jgi:periplasmic protein TonB
MSKLTWDDLVFENRNKLYGAYQLRRSYGATVAISFIVALLILTFVMALPIMKRYFSKDDAQLASAKAIKYTDLAPPPAIDANKPPPPKLDLPPPVKETIKFLPPKVTEKEVLEEELPTIDDLKKTEVSTETQEGETEVEFEKVVEEAVAETGEDLNMVYTIVQQQPEFIGGAAAMMKFIGQHVKYPASARRMGTEGSVFVSFVVEPDGKISEVQTIKGISVDCDKEAMRVIQSMPPWKPGKQNGKAVRVRFVLPVKFVLSI